MKKLLLPIYFILSLLKYIMFMFITVTGFFLGSLGFITLIVCFIGFFLEFPNIWEKVAIGLICLLIKFLIIILYGIYVSLLEKFYNYIMN